MTVSWSYSRLNQFETCPRRFQLTAITKEVRDVMGPEAEWGNRVHKALELRVKDGKPLPPTLVNYEPLAASILATPCDKIRAEEEYCFDENFKPVSWFSKEAWFRAKVDVELEKGSTCLALDYKTGKRKPDSVQLQLFAATIMTAKPKITKVKTGFIWLKVVDDNGNPKVDRETYVADDVEGIWGEFLPRVERMTEAVEFDKFPARPSGLCRNYCPVTKKHCPHSGRDR